MLASSKQAPRVQQVVNQVITPAHTAGDHDEHPPVQQVVTSTPSSDAQVEIVRLRGELESAGLREQLAKLTAERDAAQQQLEHMQARHRHELTQLAGNLSQMRADLTDWRERHDAREAELRALRAMHETVSGAPWWRRMLGGPVQRLELDEA